jgi:cobyric acid synthase
MILGASAHAEIDLKKNDIANMRIARRADAACVLISDIDRRKYEFFAPISNPPACNTLEVTF